MFNPKRFWLYYCYTRNKYLHSLEDSVRTFTSFGSWNLKPKHKKALRAIFMKALKKEWRGEIDNYDNLLRHFNYID